MDDEGRPIDRSIDSSANNTLLINSEGVIAFYDQSDTLLPHKINSEAEYQDSLLIKALTSHYREFLEMVQRNMGHKTVNTNYP